MDATCYESYISLPSNIKLIFRSTEWLDQFLSKYAKESNLKQNRYKREILRRYKLYAKKKLKRKKEKRKLTRGLLYILGKLLSEQSSLMGVSFNKNKTKNCKQKRISEIKKIYNQQLLIYTGEKVKDKIIIIDKSYIHTIIQGKEKKPYK